MRSSACVQGDFFPFALVRLETGVFKTKAKVAPYYAAADAFMIATLEDNWSLVVPEAMACALPVLSSVHNGCWPELVRAGENGWTFTPQEVAPFANVLRAASAKGRDGLAAMGARSAEIVAGYGARNAAHSVLEACKLAMAHRGRTPG